MWDWGLWRFWGAQRGSEIGIVAIWGAQRGSEIGIVAIFGGATWQ